MRAGSRADVDMDEAIIESRDSANRRADDERREFSWRTVFFGFMRSRRRAFRRVEDNGVIFLDWHHPWLFFLATGLSVFVLRRRDPATARPFRVASLLEIEPGEIIQHQRRLRS